MKDVSDSIIEEANIVAKATPKGGSQDYMNYKWPAIAINKILNSAQTMQQRHSDWLRHASVIGSKLATIGWSSTISNAAVDITNSQFEASDATRNAVIKHYGEPYSASYLTSPKVADWMLKRAQRKPGDTEVNDKLNFDFFTHNHLASDDPLDGSLNRININKLVEQFHNADPDKRPNLHLTSNHALAADNHHIANIMKGNHAFAEYSFADSKTGRRKHLHLLHRTEQRDAPIEQREHETIMLAAVDNRWNAWGNGGTFLHRWNHMNHIYELEENEALNPDEREAAYIGDGHAQISPASVMIGLLLLKLITKQPENEPEKVHIPSREEFLSFSKDPNAKLYNGDLQQAFVQSDEPIELRDDAAKILQHILPQGYSKGGQIITDAIDVFWLNLSRHRGNDRNAERIFTIDDKPITDEQIADLTFNMGILAVNPGITPLNKHQLKMGMRRLTIRNRDDKITCNFFAHPFMQDRMAQNKDGRDDVYTVIPKKDDGELGHGPTAAMGKRHLDGSKASIGYILDPDQLENDLANAHEVRSRVRVIHAADFDAVGISNVIKDNQDGSYHIEFSRGASNEAIERVEALISEALTKERAGHIECNLTDRGSCKIVFNNIQDKNKVMAKALKAVALSKPTPNEPELFVGDHVYIKLGAEPPHISKGRAA